jgi:hypothetical protein
MTADKSFVDMAKFVKVFGKLHSVQNLLSGRLLSKNLKIKISKTIILPAALYGCETWSVTPGEERRLKVFGNRVLRRIFGPKREEVAGGWKRLHNEELLDLHASPYVTIANILVGRKETTRKT